MGLRGCKPQPTVDRFLRYVRPMDGGCWHWTGNINNKGYGRFSLGPHDTGRDRWIAGYAHRWAYEHYVEPIPDGLVVDHLCGVRRCVNPEHLRVCTSRENVLAGRGESAALYWLRRCRRGHDLNDPANVYVRPDNGLPTCGVCRRDRNKAKSQVAVAA